MEEKIKVVQYGLGPIGIEAAKLAHQKQSLELVGGIDIDPEKVGRDLSELLQLGGNLGVVSDRPLKIFEQTNPDVVLHSTGSFLPKVEDQFLTCISAGASVVSSCEELFYPYRRDKDFCQRIDAAAKEKNVTVVGTGVNPGFSMDILALTATSVCTDIQKIEATRIVDASKRRLPLQKKIGAGLTPDEFRKLVDEHRLGHIGLVESLWAVADGLGFELDDLQETIDPKVSEKLVETPYFKVRPGEVAGIIHIARGFKKGEEMIKLELQMYVGAEKPVDRIKIDGDPPIDLQVLGGIFGDKATIARMVNAVPFVLKAEPGLKTLMDIPLIHYIN